MTSVDSALLVVSCQRIGIDEPSSQLTVAHLLDRTKQYQAPVTAVDKACVGGSSHHILSFFYFYFILTLIWLLSHAELLDTSFVDLENFSRNKN